jgi:hypothetical protein
LKQLTLRFSRWAGPIDDAFSFFSALIQPLVDAEIVHVTDISVDVDIEISSVYAPLSKGTLPSRVYRLIQSKLPGGVPFGPWVDSFNLQPNPKAQINIFYTGENERPPVGPWDAYLTFDMDNYEGKNAYLPLWWYTCTDLDGARVAPYLGKEVSITKMLQSRVVDYQSRPNFCIAFVGKAYPFRLHALKRLSRFKPVDIYGAIARKQIANKFEPSLSYKFVFAFENDLYPGYVTEKVIEAWCTGAIPLYWGSDPAGYINPKAIINLNDFNNFEDFYDYVIQVEKDKDLWDSIASQPILLREPDLSDVKKVLSKALNGISL